MKFEEKTLSTKSIYKGNITEYTVQEVELPNGNKATREIVLHDDASAVISFIGEKMLFVKQYRKAIEQVCIEIPAGLIDEKESALEAAKRELEEETAYRAKEWDFVTAFYHSPGYADEKITIYEAKNLQLVSDPLEKDEDETIEVLELTYEEAWKAYEDGLICDSKTVFALFYWKMKNAGVSIEQEEGPHEIKKRN